MYHVSWAPTAPVQKPSSGMSRMHRRILASLCVLIFLFLASSATGTGTPTTPDFASPLITKGPSNQYTVIHIVLPGRLRAPSPKLQGKPLKHYNPRDTGSTRKFRRQDTASQTTATPLPTPTPGQGFVAYFQDLDGAIDADGYITFSLVKTVTDCKAFCDSVPGCLFANSYHDVNGKIDNPDLTCSLYTICHTAEQATNIGGQPQEDGSVNYIMNSDGWCKAPDPT